MLNRMFPNVWEDINFPVIPNIPAYEFIIQQKAFKNGEHFYTGTIKRYAFSEKTVQEYVNQLNAMGKDKKHQ